jgi:hypothetical protein
MRRPIHYRYGLSCVAAVLLVSGACGDGSVEREAPTTTCVTAPATTAQGLPGGGEIICGPASNSSSRSTDTTTGR